MERNIYKIGKELFITSDEEIKEGEEIKGKWLFDKDTNEVFKCLNIIAASNPDRHLFKIILATDQDLIKDGVQTIDDEFLNWFVKNPSCEEVVVGTVFGKKWKDYEYYREWHKNKVPDWAWDYKIFIPKVEPEQEFCDNCNNDICCCIVKKQETLKEYLKSRLLETEYPSKMQCAEIGAKWQQERSYSEADIKNAIHSVEVKDIKNYTKIYDGMKEYLKK